MNNGILYGVSTGPGDPELMTIKAAKVLEQARVIATPRTKNGNTIALDIASSVVDMAGKIIVYLDFPMSKEESVLIANYQRQAAIIIDYLRDGHDVAMLNIGDASLYSTFSYIRDIVVGNGFSSVVIPGVNSFSASAAVLGISLTKKNLPLTVIPGQYEELDNALSKPGTKVIMKPASQMADIVKLLSERHLLENSYAVCNCGLPEEMIYDELTKVPTRGSYLITIIVLI